MKKPVALFLSVFILFSFCSCKNTNETVPLPVYSFESVSPLTSPQIENTVGFDIDMQKIIPDNGFTAEVSESGIIKVSFLQSGQSFTVYKCKNTIPLFDTAELDAIAIYDCTDGAYETFGKSENKINMMKITKEVFLIWVTSDSFFDAATAGYFYKNIK